TQATPPPPAPTSQQSSATIQVRTNTGGTGKSAYTVPDGKTFRITDILLANPQGDEGLLTVVFGQQTITTIALETFRNQYYHWVNGVQGADGWLPPTASSSSASATTKVRARTTPEVHSVQRPTCANVSEMTLDASDVRIRCRQDKIRKITRTDQLCARSRYPR